MKKLYYPLLGIIIFLFAGCSNNSDFDPTYKCDMDAKGDWINCKTIGKFSGVTGDYCSRVDSNYEYSFGFSKLVSEISPDPIKRIKATVWVKLTDLDKKCSFVVSVNGHDNKNIFWSGHDINPLVKKVDEWVKIEVEDVLPDFDSEGASVGILVWNLNKTTAYVDDYEIRFLKE
ncbi:MAG: hypothetical protein V1904_10940 [Bacteroidota bacterium]